MHGGPAASGRLPARPEAWGLQTFPLKSVCDWRVEELGAWGREKEEFRKTSITQNDSFAPPVALKDEGWERGSSIRN